MLSNAKTYATLAAHRAQETAVAVKDEIVENKSQYAQLAAATFVVTLVSRAQGFKEGYAYAQKMHHVAA